MTQVLEALILKCTRWREPLLMSLHALEEQSILMKHMLMPLRALDMDAHAAMALFLPRLKVKKPLLVQLLITLSQETLTTRDIALTLLIRSELMKDNLRLHKSMATPQTSLKDLMANIKTSTLNLPINLKAKKDQELESQQISLRVPTARAAAKQLISLSTQLKEDVDLYNLVMASHLCKLIPLVLPLITSSQATITTREEVLTQ